MPAMAMAMASLIHQLLAAQRAGNSRRKERSAQLIGIYLKTL